jgi:tRNA(fMet)-specific endonuclease VapC
MYILDTDHLSVIDRGGVKAQHLLQRLASIDPTQVATSIISYEGYPSGRLCLSSMPFGWAIRTYASFR